MDSQEIVDENALDSEALQAQIDMSMSFAQDLVTSWIQPHKFPKSSRRNDLEKELVESMRRPPRLGVGATVPEGHQSMSREIARLKGKLSGSKRHREEGEGGSSSKLLSDAEVESKATAVKKKKKAKADPFDVVHGKKKKQKKISPGVPPSPVMADQAKDDSSGEVEDILLDPSQSPIKKSFNPLESKPAQRKNKRKKARQIEAGVSQELAKESDSEGGSASSDNKFVADTLLRSEGTALATPGVVEVTLTSTSQKMNTPKKGLAVDLAKVPLLNLTGPPPDDLDSDDSATGTPATTPKKKRKRRKKKKNNVMGNTSDTLA